MDAAPTVAHWLRVLEEVEDDSAGFLARCPFWVLVGRVPVEDNEWTFRTQGGGSARAVRSPTGVVEAMLDLDDFAWSLGKRSSGVFSQTVLLGRANNNDVVVPHASVSKLHARLSCKEGDLIVLSDAGSSNGTMVNGEPVSQQEEVALTSGDLVRLGSCVFQVFGPRHFLDILRRFRDQSAGPA
jgi:hypothetical protein